jgi:hypothetical protein
MTPFVPACASGEPTGGTGRPCDFGELPAALEQLAREARISLLDEGRQALLAIVAREERGEGLLLQRVRHANVGVLALQQDAFRACQGQRPLPGQRLGAGEGALEECGFILEDAVHQPDALGALRPDRLAAEYQLARPAGADVARQSAGAAKARDQA